MSSRFPVTLVPTRTRLSRRDLLGFAAKGAASVVVSQSLLLACAAGASGTTTGTTSGSATCVLTAALTEGPFFVDDKLNRSDVRTDPVTGAVSAGIPLALTFNVSRYAANACTPLTGAYLDVWHCDSTGTYEFTSQFFFNETLTDSVYTLSPYSSRSTRNTRNASDGIYNSLSTADKAGLTLQTTKTTDGYAGVINLGVNVG
jgi:hypothetical protein